jgi:predicted ATPase/DNA-binding CsgD family transcriptional regulator
MRNRPAQTTRLTARESEVAGLVAAGKSNRAIAEALWLSERTVEHHVRIIFSKLDAHSRVDVANILRAESQVASTAAVTHAPENNLPLQLNSFVNRTEEVAELTRLLKVCRLVTVTGSGGVGKTRTSLQVAASLLADFRDGTWFIELAPLARGDYVARTIAKGIGVTLGGDGDQLDPLVTALKSKAALLIFDNCEHLIGPTAEVAAAILGQCPDVRILATSRRPLGIAGEEAYRLRSLSVPPRNDCARINASDAMAFAAIQLFVARAQTVRKGFAFTDDIAPAVADICCRLDGIPFAIELAASRVTVLDPRQLHDRLDERFNILTGGFRNALPRHQTLRGLLDWSYDLLAEHERELLRRLSIFANGFDLDAAVAVSDMSDDVVLDGLSSLIEQSMILAEPDRGSLRYRLLESTRAYAGYKLGAAEERDLISTRHLAHLRDRFAEMDERETQTGRPAETIDYLRTELEDVRAALDGALARGDAGGCAALLAHIGIHWSSVGLATEGAARIEHVLPLLSGDDAALFARLSRALSVLCVALDRKQRALSAATEAVESARQTPDNHVLADALIQLCMILSIVGKFEAAEEALAEADSIPGLIGSLCIKYRWVRARLLHMRGDQKGAASILRQLREEFRLLGDVRFGHRAALALAEAEHARGNSQQAIALVREVLPQIERSADSHTAATILANLAGYLIANGDLRDAAEAASEAIAYLAERDPGSAWVVAALEHFALVYALLGDFARAATLSGFTEAGVQRLECGREFTEIATYTRLVALLRENLEPEELESLSSDGARLRPELAVAIALAGMDALQN